MNDYFYNDDYNYMERINAQRIARLARTRQIKRQKALLLIGIFLTILLISIFSIRAYVYANDNTANFNGTKQYTSVLIYCGDTVESIAHANYDSSFKSEKALINEIRAINNISAEEKLIAGNYIVVPYYK